MSQAPSWRKCWRRQSIFRETRNARCETWSGSRFAARQTSKTPRRRWMRAPTRWASSLPRARGGSVRARRIIAALPRKVETVGVFVNQKSEAILETAEKAGLTGVQLHGDETLEFAH